MAKKIGAVVSLTIIAILIIVTIVMANTNINYGVVCAQPDHVSVEYQNNASRGVVDDKDKVVEMIANASKESNLQALFNGDLGKKAELTQKAGKLPSNNSTFYVRYRFDNAQIVKDGNSVFKDKDDKTYTYDELVFEIASSEGEQECKVYVIASSEANKTYSFYYTIDADFASTFEYLEDYYK